MKTLDNKKVFVSTPETSKAVQEKAFKLGYEWRISGAQSMHTHNPFLYFNPDNTIGDDSSFEYFRGSKFEEITAAEILAMDIPEPQEKFYAFQKVLVRNEDGRKWIPNFYESKDERRSTHKHRMIGGVSYNHCIDYKKNKHFAFTTGKP